MLSVRVYDKKVGQTFFFDGHQCGKLLNLHVRVVLLPRRDYWNEAILILIVSYQLNNLLHHCVPPVFALLFITHFVRVHIKQAISFVIEDGRLGACAPLWCAVCGAICQLKDQPIYGEHVHVYFYVDHVWCDLVTVEEYQ